MSRRFIGDVEAKWLVEPGPDRHMVLTKPFSFEDKAGKIWTAPIGACIDGASIPRLLWRLGPPFIGNYRRASVIHDHYTNIGSRTESWRATHRVFYECCRADKVGRLKAKLMFLAVYAFGPKWTMKGETLASLLNQSEISVFSQQIDPKSVSVQSVISDAEMQRLSDWIMEGDPDIQAIEASIDAVAKHTITLL